MNPRNHTIGIRRPELLFFRSLILSVLLLGGIIPDSRAQSFNVVDVKVEGNKEASTNLILSVANIKTGDQLSSATTQDAIKRLYGLGFFKDVSINAEEVTGGISVLIKVVELPKLTGVEFKGNTKFKSKDLLEKIKIGPGSYALPSLIFDKKVEIEKLYAEKGYFLAKAAGSITYSADSSQVFLTYKIDEGSKVKVANVVLTGNSRLKASDIIGNMRNRRRGFLKSSDFDKEKYPEDKDKIIEYMHKKGFIDSYLKSDSFKIDTAINRMTIYLDIYEGPRYYFGKTDFKGNEIFKSPDIASILKYREGQVFDQDKFDKSTYEIYFLYQEKGYLHTRIVDDRKTRDTLIDITFDIVEGLPSKVNLVNIIGNTKTKEKVIRREMSLAPGQVFHRSLLIRSIRDIMQLNYFANVTPDISDLPSGDVDVQVKVEEKATGQISAGAGYSGQDKFVGTFGLGIPNFRGMGQNLSFSVDVGSRRNSYSISFTEPWLFSTPTLLGTELYFTNRRWYDDYTEGRRGGSIRIGRRLRWPDNYFRLYANYRLEGDRFYDFSTAYTQAYSEQTYNHIIVREANDVYSDTLVTTYGKILPGSLLDYQERWFNSSSMGFTLERDSRNLPEFATSGSVLSYTFSNTGNVLGGHWNYQKHMIEVDKFIPVFWKIALAGKLVYGAIMNAGGDDKILEFDRFSPGGTGYDGIVRGYDDGSLTPDTTTIVSDTTYYHYYSRLADSSLRLDSSFAKSQTINGRATVRGKFMLIGNLELQIPVIQNQLYTLLFFDMGNSWLNARDIKISGLYKGVGLGFRLVVPGVGTIGFDFGYPLDKKDDQKKGWHPHFQVGTTFR